jgi:hypothetical protein
MLEERMQKAVGKNTPSFNALMDIGGIHVHTEPELTEGEPKGGGQNKEKTEKKIKAHLEPSIQS